MELDTLTACADPRLSQRNPSFGPGRDAVPPRWARNKHRLRASNLSMPRFRRPTKRKNVNVDEGHYLTVAWAYLRVMYAL